MEKLSRFSLMVLPLAVCSSGNAQKKQQTTESRPNIIYIMSDDHSYNAISAYGSAVSKLAPTPNIDKIANEGIIYERAFVENSLSTPSRACTMTGLYSFQNGQRQLSEGIDTTKVFFTELLQKAGYQTAIVGKWHMMCNPKGFDYYHIYSGQGEYYNPQFKGTDTNGKYVQEFGYSSTLVTKHAIEYLEYRDKNKPFCLMIHQKAPHRNQMPDLKYLDLYNNVTFPIPETFFDDYESRSSAAKTQKMSINKDLELVQDLKIEELIDKPTTPYLKMANRWLLAGLNRMTPDQREIWNKHYKPRNEEFLKENLKGKVLDLWKYQEFLKDYLRCVKSVDDGVGEIYDYLKKNGLLDNTVIIYTSDQGFYIGEHNWFDKRFMYEESFRTPLLIRYPKFIKPGTKSSTLVQNIDYAPTFLELAGLKKTDEMPGRSLIPTFSGKTPRDWRTSLYYHYFDYPTFHMVRKHDGVRTDRYKLIHFYGKGGMRGATSETQTTKGTAENMVLQMLNNVGYITNDSDIDAYELYDLKNDPNELHNLYGKPSYEKTTKKLKALLHQYRENLKVPIDEESSIVQSDED
jgi:arylsulfatase A-like enzyme